MEPEDLDMEEIIANEQGNPTVYFESIVFQQNEILRLVTSGSGSPEGVVTATPGHIYLNSDGGAGTTLFVKESGTGNTGWIGK